MRISESCVFLFCKQFLFDDIFVRILQIPIYSSKRQGKYVIFHKKLYLANFEKFSRTLEGRIPPILLSTILRIRKKMFRSCFEHVQILGIFYSIRLVYWSALKYGILFWGTTGQYQLKIIFIIQKKIKFIVNVNRTDSCKFYTLKQKIMTMIMLLILETSCLIFI